MGKSCNSELKGKEEMGSVAAEVKVRLRPAPAPPFSLSFGVKEVSAEKLWLESEESRKGKAKSVLKIRGHLQTWILKLSLL
ncbi:hypothetical protein V6N12_049961 [Hibiscus sabdariffa]|uniref:Uncharacterized protein n=1 Tax=Hibiscus sabdariffa TaxID=183260 RepID=A0ABR2GB18_9ROSI